MVEIIARPMNSLIRAMSDGNILAKNAEHSCVLMNINSSSGDFHEAQVTNDSVLFIKVGTYILPYLFLSAISLMSGLGGRWRTKGVIEWIF